MRTLYLSKWGLTLILLLAVWNVGQAQDSLGMQYLSGLSYWYSAESIQMVGDLVYVVNNSFGLYIISLADPANPVEIGRFTWFQWYGATGGAYVLGNRAYLGLYYGGFVLDVSDPTHPVALGQWTDLGSGPISFVHDDWAVAETDEGYPYVLDISDPTNVHQIGDFPISGFQRGMGMAGDYLCLYGHPGGLSLFDMSDPNEPQWVASVDSNMCPHHSAMSGNYAYLATDANGLRIIDLSNPLQPVEVASCDSIGWTWGVTVTGFYAVTAKSSPSDTWLNVWNITDPTHPVLESTFRPQALASSIVSSSGNLVCTPMTGSDNSIMVVDISNPAAPAVASSFGPYGLLKRVAISGTTAYLADRITGLQTVDLTDPYHVSELAHMNANGVEGFDVAVRGNYAYVVEPLLIVIDVSNPAQPESLGCVFPQGGLRIVTDGDYAYAAGNYLCTFSLANPAVPQCVDSFYIGALPGDDIGFTVSDGYLYFGARSTLYVYGLSNPAAPQLLGSCNLGGGSWVFDLAAAGHCVYVAGGVGGMRIVNAGDPGHPSELNWIDGYWVGPVAASGNMVVMDDLTRISIWDVSNPLNPALEGYYSTYEYLTDIQIQGQYLFTVSASDFRVYQCDALTSAVLPADRTPYEFALYPCYPNPFNEVTAISYEIPITGLVNMSIFNVLGQHVTTLVKNIITPGKYSILWNAANLPSGMYFCRMEIGGFDETRKLLLLK
jgi:hypothetical protein